MSKYDDKETHEATKIANETSKTLFFESPVPSTSSSSNSSSRPVSKKSSIANSDHFIQSYNFRSSTLTNRGSRGRLREDPFNPQSADHSISTSINPKRRSSTGSGGLYRKEVQHPLQSNTSLMSGSSASISPIYPVITRSCTGNPAKQSRKLSTAGQVSLFTILKSPPMLKRQNALFFDHEENVPDVLPDHPDL